MSLKMMVNRMRWGRVEGGRDPKVSHGICKEWYEGLDIPPMGA